MTPIEELLRQALHDAPAPATSGDPLAAVERGVRRARLHFAAVVGVVAAVLAVAVVVPLLTLSARPGPVGPARTPKPSPSPSTGAIEVWPVHDAVAVATTVDGSVWTLQHGAGLDRATVVQQNATGAVVRRIPIPGPARGIVAGAGSVWTYGGGDGGAPDGVLNQIGPAGKVTTLRFTGAGPYDIAFVDGTPFVTLPSARRVVTIGDDGSGRLVETGSLQASSQVTDIVATDNGQVWVREDPRHRAVRVRTNGGQLSLGGSFDWPGGLVGPAPNNGIWTSDSPNRLVDLSPALAARGSFSLAEGYRIGLPGNAVGLPVVGNGSRGGYVATDRGVVYYVDFSRAAASTPANPTAVLPRRDVVAMSAAPSGGVVVVTANGREIHWRPALVFTVPTKCCVAPPSPRLRMTVAPTAGSPGTIVNIRVTDCDDPTGENHAISFNNDATDPAARNNPNTVRSITAVQHGTNLTATYTITRGDETGGVGAFFVQCGQTLRQKSFHVTP